LQEELNINRQIIEEFVEDGADSEEHSTSIEDISSIEIIPTTVEKDRKARANTQIPVSTTTTATPKQKRESKKEQRKDSFEKARAWALDHARDKERKRK